MRYPAILGAALGLLLASACSEPTSDNSLDPSQAKGRITPDCELGCNDPPPDTDPGTPVIGVFLGSGVTDQVCFNGSQSDSDADGLSDFCEKNLAAAFAPQLALTKGSDNLGREPKWAGKRLGTTLKARFMYLLSYYVDRGPPANGCGTNAGDFVSQEDWTAACQGHDGDSEWIALDVYYNRSTSRWILDAVYLSQHTGVKTISRGARTHPLAFQYPGVAGGYPRVYVAYQKHANYESDAACDAGAILGADTCQADTFERVPGGDNLNIKSRAVHTAAQDCWPSSNPIYSGNGIKECYWTFKQFLGWHVGWTGKDSEYSPKLSKMGF